MLGATTNLSLHRMFRPAGGGTGYRGSFDLLVGTTERAQGNSRPAETAWRVLD
ncbi:MAG TPA: hypothetical protein VGX24_02055 [Pyrinomonadaceae bacterium]|jgi:hypothetical protein|nr:hypothetical protein [Pyrinomonadaceae bacterium]